MGRDRLTERREGQGGGRDREEGGTEGRERERGGGRDREGQRDKEGQGGTGRDRERGGGRDREGEGRWSCGHHRHWWVVGAHRCWWWCWALVTIEGGVGQVSLLVGDGCSSPLVSGHAGQLLPLVHGG